jgi:hypothetical protein
MPLWDGDKWHLWVPGPEGLVSAKIVDIKEGSYIAKSPADDSDLHILFAEFMWQRASFPEIRHLIEAIISDFHNMSACVAKLRLFHDSRDSLRIGDPRQFAITELEYLAVLARGVFDLLQASLARIWEKRVRLTDENWEKRRKGHPLPVRFSRLIVREEQSLRTAKEIEDDFGLPPEIARAYTKHGSFFLQLRAFRDDIIHHGHSLSFLTSTEKGFCVIPTMKPFSSYEGWLPQHWYNENCVSLLPWVADIVIRTIDACDTIVDALSRAIDFPPEIAPGYRVYIRGSSNPALLDVLRVHEGGSPWWN